MPESFIWGSAHPTQSSSRLPPRLNCNIFACLDRWEECSEEPSLKLSISPRKQRKHHQPRPPKLGLAHEVRFLGEQQNFGVTYFGCASKQMAASVLKRFKELLL